MLSVSLEVHICRREKSCFTTLKILPQIFQSVSISLPLPSVFLVYPSHILWHIISTYYNTKRGAGHPCTHVELCVHVSEGMINNDDNRLITKVSQQLFSNLQKPKDWRQSLLQNKSKYYSTFCVYSWGWHFICHFEQTNWPCDIDRPSRQSTSSMTAWSKGQDILL